MQNKIKCKHIFPKKVKDYIFGDAYRKCTKCKEVINTCAHERENRKTRESKMNQLTLS